MTATPCFGPDDVERVASLSAGHALRVHARECPRCGALLASYQLYLDRAAGPTPAQIEDADARLSAALARELGGVAPAPGPAAAPGVPAGAARERGRSWIEQMLHPSMRPAVLATAAVIVVGAVVLLPRIAGQHGPGALRGTGESHAIVVDEATLQDAGAVFRWRPVADAERYEVRLYSSNLQELGRFPAGASAALTIPPSVLPATGSDGHLLYRVYALRGTHVVAFSTAAPLE